MTTEERLRRMERNIETLALRVNILTGQVDNLVALIREKQRGGDDAD